MSEQAPSFRGLEEGYQALPVKHFKGKLDSFNTELRTNVTPAKEYINILFSDLTIIETREPYNFPILQISFPHSSRKSSYWGVFASSGLKFIGEDEDFPNLQGRYMELQLTPGHMMWDSSKGEETPRDCWEIINVFGEGGVDTPAASKSKSAPLDEALRLLDGKSEADFNQAVFQNEIVKAGGLIPSILDNTETGFLQTLLSTGRASKDENGIFHVNKEE